MRIMSTAFDSATEMPRRYTCEGKNISPPLAWEAVPEEAKSLALVVLDPDAPDPAAPAQTFVHWVLYDIPTNIEGLAEGADLTATNINHGVNDFGSTAYGGPCPPVGNHRYFHQLYALDTTFDSLDQPSWAELEQAMEGHVLEKAELIGRYEKKYS